MEQNNSLKGKIITNKNKSYILVNKLGSGSYASVWMCYARNTKKLMAIKMFKTEEYRAGQKEIETYKKN
jgi:serine/threonine protein kinase